MMRIGKPRLLPLTMALMALLLIAKTAVLVRSAVSTNRASLGLVVAAQAATPEAAPQAPAPAASKPPPPPAKPLPQAATAAAASSRAAPAEDPVSDSERALLQDLRHRRAELEAREATLGAREAVLSAAERRLSTRIDELVGLQNRLEALEQGRREHDEANWRGLVKLYETMRPRDAAAIFNDLDKPVLLGVLDRMKEAKAAPVLAAMSPERARQATADLAAVRAKATAAPGDPSRPTP